MNSNIRNMTRSGILLAITIVFQFIGRNIPQINQFLVGSVVNAVLIISVVTCGTWWGAGIGVLTPVTALISGQLPVILAAFIPFVMLGNFIYTVSFGFLKGYKPWGKYGGYILGSILKYSFLAFSSLKLAGIFKINIPSKVIASMGIPQLVTALIGGAIAIVLTGVLKNKIEVEGYYGKH